MAGTEGERDRAAQTDDGRAAEFGAALRQMRLSHGRDLADVATQLRIRQVFLQAIERGRFDELPGATYAIGFVRAYADYLGLDADEVVKRYKELRGGAGAQVPLVPPAPVTEGRLPAGPVLLVAAVLAAVVYGGWYYLTLEGRDPGEVVSTLPERIARMAGMETGAPTAPSSAPASAVSTAVSASTGDGPEKKESAPPVETAAPAQPTPAQPAPPAPTLAVTETAVPASPAPAPADTAASEASEASETARPVAPAPADAVEVAAPPATPDGTPTADAAVAPPVAPGPAPEAEPSSPPADGRVVLRANASSWIEIRNAEERRVFSRLLRRGETYSVPPMPGLTLTTGNAGGIDVLVDGKVLPPLGKPGDVRRDVALDADSLIRNAGRTR